VSVVCCQVEVCVTN